MLRKAMNLKGVVLLVMSLYFRHANGIEGWKYAHQLSPGFLLQWNYRQDSIEMKITGETKGWIGIGFAPTRSMAGADLIIGGIRNDKRYVWDCYATSNGPPSIDAVQNVQVTDGFENATHTTITVTRPLISNNAFDKTIQAGKIIVLWAIGNMDMKNELTMLEYHDADRGFVEIELLRGKEQKQKAASGKTPPMTPLESEPIGFPYNAVLDHLQPVNLYWDFDESTITIQIIAPTKGWVGVGFSRTTSMNGADIIMTGVRSGEAYALDCNSDRNGVPAVDQDQSIEVIGGWENETHTGVTIRRNRLTCNSDDMDLESGTYKVIWAYGTNDLPDDKLHFGYYHGWNRGGVSLKLINPITVRKSSELNEEFHANIGPSDFLVPAKSTYYLCEFAKFSEANETIYITGIHPYFTKGNERNVHHVTIFLCDVEISQKQLTSSYSCYDEINPFFAGCSKILGGWAVGGSGTVFPTDSGFPVGGYSHPQYVLVEMHYDNPERREFVDSSGMRISYVREKPGTLVGLFDIEHSLTTIWIPPGAENFQLGGYCRENCLNTAMKGAGVDEIKIFGVFVHSHLAGTKMRLRHFRNGTELLAVASDDHYDFNYQEIQYFEEPKSLQAGDSLTLECGYTTLDRTNITPGGLPTTSEMCIAYILHYPPLRMTLCGSRGKVYENLSVLANGLNVSLDPKEVERVGMEIIYNYWSAMEILWEKLFSGVVWDDGKRAFAQEFMENTKQYASCLYKSDAILNYFEEFTPPKVEEYVDGNPSCPSTKE